MEFDRSVKIERPMQRVIQLAREHGFNNNPELSKYHQCLEIKHWLFKVHDIFVYVVPHRDYTFVGYYRNLRKALSHPKKLAPFDIYQQAFVESLEYAMKKEL